MRDIRLGYSEPEVTEDRLSDGPKVYGVLVRGDYVIQIHCTDRQAAENLRAVWDFGVVSVDVEAR